MKKNFVSSLLVCANNQYSKLLSIFFIILISVAGATDRPLFAIDKDPEDLSLDELIDELIESEPETTPFEKEEEEPIIPSKSSYPSYKPTSYYPKTSVKKAKEKEVEYTIDRKELIKNLNTFFDLLSNVTNATDDSKLFDSEFREKVTSYRQPIVKAPSKTKPSAESSLSRYSKSPSEKINPDDFIPLVKEVESVPGLLSLIKIILSKKSYQMILANPKYTDLLKMITETTQSLSNLKIDIDDYATKVKESASFTTEEMELRKRLLPKAERDVETNNQQQQKLQKKLLDFYKNLKNVLTEIKKVFTDKELMKKIEAKRKEHEKASSKKTFRPYDRGYGDYSRNGGWPSQYPPYPYKKAGSQADYDDYSQSYEDYGAPTTTDKELSPDTDTKKDSDSDTGKLQKLGKASKKKMEEEEKKKKEAEEAAKKKKEAEEAKIKEQVKKQQINTIFTNATTLLTELCTNDIKPLQSLEIDELATTFQKVNSFIMQKTKAITTLEISINEISKRLAEPRALSEAKASQEATASEEATASQEAQASEETTASQEVQMALFTAFVDNASKLLTLSKCRAVEIAEQSNGRYVIVAPSTEIQESQTAIGRCYKKLNTLLPASEREKIIATEKSIATKLNANLTSALTLAASSEHTPNLANSLLEMNIDQLNTTVSHQKNLLSWIETSEKEPISTILDSKEKDLQKFAETLDEIKLLAQHKYSEGLQKIIFDEQMNRAKKLSKETKDQAENIGLQEANILLQKKLQELIEKGKLFLEADMQKQKLSFEDFITKHLSPAEDNEWAKYPTKKSKTVGEDKKKILAELRSAYRYDKTAKSMNDLEQILLLITHIQEKTKLSKDMQQPSDDVKINEALWVWGQPIITTKTNQTTIEIPQPEACDTQGYIWQKTITDHINGLKEEAIEKKKPFAMPKVIETKLKADLSNFDAQTKNKFFQKIGSLLKKIKFSFKKLLRRGTVTPHLLLIYTFENKTYYDITSVTNDVTLSFKESINPNQTIWKAKA